MKKIISAVLVFILTIGLSSTAFALQIDGFIARVRPPEVLLDSETDYFVNGEDINFSVRIFDNDILNLEQVKIYIDCNKNVLKYEGERVFASTQRTEFAMDETETGYVVTFTDNGQSDIGISECSVVFSFHVNDAGSPDVNARAEIKYTDKDIREAVFGASLPVNEIFERKEIPVLSLTGDLDVFVEDGILYLNDAKDLSELKQKITSTISGYEVVYDSFGDDDRDYAVTGDKYYIEFRGYYSDKIEVCVVGDVDRNGKITAGDARLALTYAAKTAVYPENFPKSADIDRNGRMTASDARMILRVAAKIDYFRTADKSVLQNQSYTVGPLVSKSDAGYLWRCTVSEEGAIKVEEEIEPSVDNSGKAPDEIIVGAPALQTFTLTPLKQGRFEVHFELIQPWEEHPIAEFGFTVVVDGAL